MVVVTRDDEDLWDGGTDCLEALGRDVVEECGKHLGEHADKLLGPGVLYTAHEVLRMVASMSGWRLRDRLNYGTLV